MTSRNPPVSPDAAASPREKRIRLFGCLALGAVLLLGGCGGPQAISAPASEPAASAAPSGGDVTAQFLATQWGKQFEGVVMDVDQEFTEDGTTMRLDADTNLTSPQDVAQAVEICEALKSAFRDDWGKLFYVRVNEMNGTVFLTNQGGCGDPRAQ